MASLKDITASVEAHEKGVPIPIYDANAEPYLALDGTPATITVLGAESRKLRKAQEDYDRERRKKHPFGSPGDGSDHELEKIVMAVVDWHGWDDGKKDLPCTPENVRAILGAPEAEHILRQVRRGVQAHGLFSKRASAS